LRDFYLRRWRLRLAQPALRGDRQSAPIPTAQGGNSMLVFQRSFATVVVNPKQ